MTKLISVVKVEHTLSETELTMFSELPMAGKKKYLEMMQEDLADHVLGVFSAGDMISVRVFIVEAEK